MKLGGHYVTYVDEPNTNFLITKKRGRLLGPLRLGVVFNAFRQRSSFFAHGVNDRVVRVFGLHIIPLLPIGLGTLDQLRSFLFVCHVRHLLSLFLY
jgi:hypothetical protein